MLEARSQMARTYLEKNADKFADCSRDDLVKHGLRALKETLVEDRELTVDNTSIAVVGGKAPGKKAMEFFKVHDGADVKDWINSVADDAEAAGEEGAGGEVGEDLDVEVFGESVHNQLPI